jgi:hypothetical protein
MDKSILQKIRLDSLSKHDGMTYRYGSLPLDSCKTVIVDRNIDSSEIRVVFEESDGYGHGLNVPTDWLTEDHISRNRVACPRCGGAGKLTLYGVDCTECNGTGKVPGKVTIQ